MKLLISLAAFKWLLTGGGQFADPCWTCPARWAWMIIRLFKRNLRHLSDPRRLFKDLFTSREWLHLSDDGDDKLDWCVLMVIFKLLWEIEQNSVAAVPPIRIKPRLRDMSNCLHVYPGEHGSWIGVATRRSILRVKHYSLLQDRSMALRLTSQLAINLPCFLHQTAFLNSQNCTRT